LAGTYLQIVARFLAGTYLQIVASMQDAMEVNEYLRDFTFGRCNQRAAYQRLYGTELGSVTLKRKGFLFSN
jgi:hypothetical protein